jgi:putative hydroxymethylpyrimidine transport system permease protein
MNIIRDYAGAAVLIVCLFAAWETGARMYDQPFIIPSPTQIAVKLWELRDSLFFIHLPATLQVILIGLVLSMAAGVGVAVLMVRYPLIERTLYPVVIASQTIPIIALAPVFVLWFGYSIWSKVAVTVLITFFPLTVSTYDGLLSVQKQLSDLLLTMGATRNQVFWKVAVPSALPYFFSGLKVAVTLSVIGAAIGEWLGADAGLGYFSRRMMTQFDGAGVFAPIILLSLLGILLFITVKMVEAFVLKWRKTT